MLRGVLESQAPPRQYASETIDTFSGRLVSATLLEDKRQAIQGLRSFAKQYPASVASGGLKALIESLTRDIEDVDTGKIVLETLLFLFNPDEDSPEADDDIALLVADQFTQRQDHVAALLDLLENHDYYARLYALRLLLSISNARPERTQECIQNAPLGIPRLVAVLDDSREAIRTAGLDLLNDITESSIELQKIVAFQDAFARIFSLIHSEGSLSEGGIVVQDCLNLLANLLRLNPSNQTTFREEGFVPRLASLFNEPQESEEEEIDSGIASANKLKNIWGILAVLRMFLIRGSIGTQANQVAFFRHRLLEIVLQLAFNPALGPRIRAEALRTTADMIRNNADLQERFGGMQVPFPSDSSPTSPMNGSVMVNGFSSRSSPDPRHSGSRPPSRKQQSNVDMVYVIEALLDLALSTHTISLFDVRYAAVDVISAYTDNHAQIRAHVLARAVDGHKSGADETGNIITVLFGGPSAYASSDPYRIWFATAIALRLVSDDNEAKEKLRSVTEGDEEAGEEVVTCVQAVTGHLITSFQSGLDERICIAYLTLLCGWLFECVAAINDLLSEGSTLQSLITLAAKPTKSRELSQGLTATLLGIVYEFSTKDSPIPRTKLQPLLTSGLGREQYISRLTTLRSQPSLRDFEVIPQDLSTAPLPGTLPEIFFSDPFVPFLKDNFSRLLRALDKDPKKEILPQSEVGVDRDVIDELRGQITSLTTELADFKTTHEDAIMEREKRLTAFAAELRRATDEAERIKRLNDGLQRNHADEVKGAEARAKAATERLRADHTRALQDAQSKSGAEIHAVAKRLQEAEASHARRTQESERNVTTLERTVKGHEDTLGRLKTQLSDVQKAKKEADDELNKSSSRAQALENEKAVLQESLNLANANVRKLEAQSSDTEKNLKDARMQAAELRKELDAVKEEGGTSTEQVRELQSRERELEEAVARLEREQAAKLEGLEKQVQEKEKARKAAQGELDDLFVMLGDLEEKRTRDRKKLRELGAEVSEGEDDDEGDDEDEGESEEEGEDEEDEDDNDEEESEQDGKDEDEDEEDEGAQAEGKDNEEKEKAGGGSEETSKPGHERESSID